MRGVALRLLWLLEGPSFFSSADGLLNSAVAVSLAVRRWCIMDGKMLQRRYRIGHVHVTSSTHVYRTVPGRHPSLNFVVFEVLCVTVLASFPGLPRLQFLIACSMQKWKEKGW